MSLLQPKFRRVVESLYAISEKVGSSRPAQHMVGGFVGLPIPSISIKGAATNMNPKTSSDARIHRLKRYDDHDRSRPSDFSFEYQGELITVEVKSLQTSSVRSDNGGFTGKIQVDKSDKSPTTMPDGSQIQTTCLEVGKWDILAATCSSLGINGVSALSGTETYQGLPMPSTQSTSVAICFERLCL